MTKYDDKVTLGPPSKYVEKTEPIKCAECGTTAQPPTLRARHEAGWRFRHTPGPATQPLTLNICPDHAREGDW